MNLIEQAFAIIGAVLITAGIGFYFIVWYLLPKDENERFQK